MSVVDRSYEHPLDIEESATMTLAGGVMQNGYQCGMLWGAALAADAQAYRLYGPGEQAQRAAVAASQELVEIFKRQNKFIDCSDIIQMDWKQSSQKDFTKKLLKFLLRGGPIGCFRMAARYAPAVRSQIDEAYSAAAGADTGPHESLPLSCAALLVQKMGADEMHQVMAAGFAGGIGLSGAGCGALSAAIWYSGVIRRQEAAPTGAMVPAWANELLETFLESSDYEFECEKIAGRVFENVDDHAAYLREGGCEKIIAALAIR